MGNDYLIKTLILSISFMGFSIFITGALFLFARELVSHHIHYILPIPPIGVAAYVFVFNLFVKYDGRLPTQTGAIVSEILLATLFSALIFLFCSAIIVVMVSVTKNLF